MCQISPRSDDYKNNNVIVYFVPSAERRILTQERVAIFSQKDFLSAVHRKLALSVWFYVRKVDFPAQLR